MQVTLIAQGDVPLSIVMTVCTTLAAVVATPLLTKLLAGTYVPVDALKLSLSTLQVNTKTFNLSLKKKISYCAFKHLFVFQVVVAPVLLGSYMQSKFPSFVKAILPFAPLLAVLTSSLLASRFVHVNNITSS